MIVVRVGLARERRSNRCSGRAQKTTSFVAVGIAPRDSLQDWHGREDHPAEDADVKLDDISVKITELLDALEEPSADEEDGRPADQEQKATGLGLDADST